MSVVFLAKHTRRTPQNGYNAEVKETQKMFPWLKSCHTNVEFLDSLLISVPVSFLVTNLVYGLLVFFAAYNKIAITVSSGMTGHHISAETLRR